MKFSDILLQWLFSILRSLGAIKFTFGYSEPGVPVIPSSVMWQNVLAGLAATQSGTLTSGATTCTGLTATNGLTVNMPISGTGIAPGTVIAAIVSSTAITLSLNATASGAQTLTFTLSNPNQSIWGPGASFPGPTQAAIATDAPDCPFNIPDAQVLATTAVYTPAPGRGVLVVAAGATTAPAVQYNVNGSFVSVWTFPVSATNSAYIMADGVNVRWNNLASASSTFTFYRERSSKSTSI